MSNTDTDKWVLGWFPDQFQPKSSYLVEDDSSCYLCAVGYCSLGYFQLNYGNTCILFTIFYNLPKSIKVVSKLGKQIICFSESAVT